MTLLSALVRIPVTILFNKRQLLKAVPDYFGRLVNFNNIFNKKPAVFSSRPKRTGLIIQKQ
jgi:hypothetical protein